MFGQCGGFEPEPGPGAGGAGAGAEACEGAWGALLLWVAEAVIGGRCPALRTRAVRLPGNGVPSAADVYGVALDVSYIVVFHLGQSY